MTNVHILAIGGDVAHRVPPRLLGIVSANAGGFGDPVKANGIFFDLEIEPLQSVFLKVNERIGVEAVRYRERAALPVQEARTA